MTDVAGSGPAMVDIAILAVIAISLVFGLFRGLLREEVGTRMDTLEVLSRIN